MHATTVKNKITQRDNYKEIMSAIVVVLLLTLTLIAIFSAIDQLSISEMGRIASFKEIKCRSFVLLYLFIMPSTLTF
ncbi:hypothetical protein LL03F7_36210 [Escherichia coli]